MRYVNLPHERPPQAVLDHFAVAGLTWHRAEPGFSGATVWRGEDATGAPQVALKGWPLRTPVDRIQQVHLWLSHAARLPFVPKVFASERKQSVALVDGQFWDACAWMPGAPRVSPTAVEVCAACEAVAQLHRCWPPLAELRPCRGVVARLDMLADHRERLDEWNRRLPPLLPELDPLLRRAVSAVTRGADRAATALRAWAARPVAVQPCVRDLRGDHVLFDGDRVSGVIDFGAMAVDHPAVDLARLLGDYAFADPALFNTGLNAYRAAGAPLGVPDEFVQLLARTGAVCSIMGWLIRLFVLREPVSRPAALVARLSGLLLKVEQIAHF